MKRAENINKSSLWYNNLEDEIDSEDTEEKMPESKSILSKL